MNNLADMQWESRNISSFEEEFDTALRKSGGCYVVSTQSSFQDNPFWVWLRYSILNILWLLGSEKSSNSF